MDVSVIVLAGGEGTRMKSATPKQFLELNKRPLVHHCLEVFFSVPEIKEVILVCEEKYQHHFDLFHVTFAQPGKRRQDSVFSGVQKASHPWVIIHDGARPLISREMVQGLIREGSQAKAATVGMPMKMTVKECTEDQLVSRTLDRDQVWEVQTPQFLCKDLLFKGFEHAHKHDLTVTDDVSLAEAVGHPVKMVRGGHHNIKITTPEDLLVAKQLLHDEI